MCPHLSPLEVNMCPHLSPLEVLVFSSVLAWIYFGLALVSTLCLEPSAFPLRLNITLPQFFHLKHEPVMG